jgi:hypothetical protein
MNKCFVEVEIKLRLTVSQPIGLSILASGCHLKHMTRFFLYNCLFLDVGRPLLRDDGSVICSYNFFWALPVQSLWGPSHAELNGHILLPHLTLNWRARSPYLYPPGAAWPSYTPWVLDPLFIASYDSQGYGGGILILLHASKPA